MGRPMDREAKRQADPATRLTGDTMNQPQPPKGDLPARPLYLYSVHHTPSRAERRREAILEAIGLVLFLILFCLAGTLEYHVHQDVEHATTARP